MLQRYLLGWGSASDGQLGASSIDALTPRPLPGLTIDSPYAVAAGLWSSLVLTTDNVYATCAPDDTPRPPISLPTPDDRSSFISAARGRDFTLLLTGSGRLYSLGVGAFGELGLGDQTSASVPTLVTALSSFKIIAVAAAEFHWLALDVNGTVFSCGNNKSGQLGLSHSESVSTPTRVVSLWPQPIVAISTGDGHSAALSACGKLYCFGSNKHGQLGDSSFRVRVMSVTPASVPLPRSRHQRNGPINSIDSMDIDTPQSSFSTISPALTNGTAAPANDAMSIDKERHLLRYVDVACGSAHTVALRSDGVLVCWGMGENGRLGTRSTRTLYEPTEIEASVPFVAVSAGERHSAAVTADGRAFLWGDGSSGQIGLGDAVDKYVPVELGSPRVPGVQEPLRYLRITCGGFHTLAVVGSKFAPVYNAIEEHDKRIGRCVVDNMVHARAGLSRFGCASVLLRTFMKWGSGSENEYEVDYVGAETAHLKFIRMFGVEGKKILRLAAAQLRHQAQAAFGLIPGCKDTQSSACTDCPLITPRSQFFKDDSKFQSSVANSPESGIVLFLAMMNPLYGEVKFIPELAEVAAIVIKVDEGAREAFMQSVSGCDEDVLLNRIVRPLQKVLTDELRGYRRITRSAIFATKMLALCYHGVWRAPHRMKSRGLGTLRKEFYNETVSEMVNLKEDYERWLQRGEQGSSYQRPWLSDDGTGTTRKVGTIELPPLPAQGKDDSPFAFCSYSFLLTEEAKFRVMGIESGSSMRMETVRSLLSFGALQNPLGGPAFLTLPNEHLAHVQYLVLHVRRSQIVQDTYRQVAEIASRTPSELRKPLRVVFAGEAGVDEGGVSKEFYQVLLEQILSPDYGMFVYDEQHHIHWFQRDFLEPEEAWTLIGIMFGLAVFNSILLDVQFPPVVYRKLAIQMRNAELEREYREKQGHSMEIAVPELKYQPDLNDVKEVFPEIGNSLQHLREYEGDDVEDVFALSYEVSLRGLFDKAYNVELITNGANVAVSNENREDFISRYVEFLVNSSIERAFKPFATGFLFVLDGPFVSRLSGEELETLVIGEPELDFAGLRQAAVYEGYTERSEVIVHLWQVLDDFDANMKRLFLLFVTGTTRAPVGGLSKMSFAVHRASSDNDRLPTSHTCFNTLLLPDYGTRAKLRDRLSIAIRNSKGFGLQ